MDNTSYEARIKEFSECLSNFFLVFDSLFLYEEDAEALLKDTKKSLEDYILRNESALALILAMGGNYDSSIDRAKVAEINALLNLVTARKYLQKVTEESNKNKKDNAELLALFGL